MSYILSCGVSASGNFEVLEVFCVVTPSAVGDYQRFGRIYPLRIRDCIYLHNSCVKELISVLDKFIFIVDK